MTARYKGAYFKQKLDIIASTKGMPGRSLLYNRFGIVNFSGLQIVGIDGRIVKFLRTY